MRHLIEGQDVVIARDGKVLLDVLHKELISKADFREAMRMEEIDHIDDIKIARLETNGKITFEKKPQTSASTTA